MSGVSGLRAAVVIGIGLFAWPGHAQQQVQRSQSNPAPAVQPANRPAAPALTSKTYLATRFQQVKSQYVMLKLNAAKYASPNATEPIDVKQARLRLVSAMRSYEYYEGQMQIQRDNLNTLTNLTEADSMRMQIGLERMARLQTIISGLLNKLSETGSAVVQNTN